MRPNIPLSIGIVLAMAILSSGDATGGSPTDGLVAHYALDEGKGPRAADGSPKQHAAQLRGAKWVKRDDGHALSFDGTSAHAECGSGTRFGIADKLTVAGWICSEGRPTGEAVIIGEGPPRWGLTQFEDRVFFYVSGGHNMLKANAHYGRWVHLAGTYDGTTMKFYVNGELHRKRDLAPGTPVEAGRPFFIGGDPKKNAYFNGMIDDASVYTRVLSVREIAALAAAAKAGPDARAQPTTKAAFAPTNPATDRFFKDRRPGLAHTKSGETLLLANGKVGLEFVEAPNGVHLSRLRGIELETDYLSPLSGRLSKPLWKIEMRRDKGRDASGAVIVKSLDAARASTSFRKTPTGEAIHILWKGLAIGDEADAVDVEVVVALRPGDPLTRWRIGVTNRSKFYGIWEVLFPIVELKPIGNGSASNHFAVPYGRGVIAHDPFNSPKPAFGVGGRCLYPGTLNMQFSALHDDAGVGLYMAAHDGEGNLKTFCYDPRPARQVIGYWIGHNPPNVGYPAEDYRTPYDVCIGPFAGEAYDACQIYRKWAVKQQWAARGPLHTRDDVPTWFKEMPLTFVTSGAWGNSDLDVSVDRVSSALDFFGAPIPVTYYIWKKAFPKQAHYNHPTSPWRVPEKRAYHCTNTHDGNYPMLPALEHFSETCELVRDKGAYPIAYVCSSILDPGLNENAPMAKPAKPSVILDVNGDLRMAEAKLVSWLMCYHAEWWQQRMADTVTLLMEKENIHRIYFDTFYGGRYQNRCFDTSHGHSYGGGSVTYQGARKMSRVVRGAMKRKNPEAVMSGENPAETAIDLLDGFLYRASMWPGMAPLFATVYGDYVTRHGIRMEPVDESFFVACAALFTEGGAMGRLRLNGDFDWLKNVEAGTPVSEMMLFVRKLARYWKPGAAGKHLAYGKLLRPIAFTRPSPMPAVTVKHPNRKMRRYNEGIIDTPAIMSGALQAPDGSLGVALVNVSPGRLQVALELTPGRYPIAPDAKYTVVAIDEFGKPTSPATRHEGKVTWAGELGGHDAVFVKAIPNEREADRRRAN